MKSLCALYLRVSTDNQADHGVSLPAQQSRLIAYCKAHGWDVYKIYSDDGYSGKNLDRPNIKRLINDAKQRKFEHVAVIKLDRISRSQKDALYLIEDIFTKNDVSFHSVSESFDTNTPFGKASLGMLSVFAQLEREMIVDRILVAKKECAKQGRYLGGFVPYGYDYSHKDKKYLVEPITAATVRKIFDLYCSGEHGFQSICNLLDENKIPTPHRGKRWDKSVIRKMLLNPVYIGMMPHRGLSYDAPHDPIISVEQFETATDMVRKRYTPIPTKEDDNLLTGMIYCGECGARMRYKRQNWNTPNKSYNQQYYICYTQYGSKGMATATSCDCGFKKSNEVNAAVIDYVLSLGNNKKALESEIKKAVAIDEHPSGNESEQIKSELAKINKKIDKWYTAFEDDDINSKQLSERIKNLRDQQTELESRLAIITERENISEQRKISNEAVKAMIYDMPKRWPKLSPDEQRAYLGRVIKKVTVNKGNEINVSLRL